MIRLNFGVVMQTNFFNEEILPLENLRKSRIVQFLTVKSIDHANNPHTYRLSFELILIDFKDYYQLQFNLYFGSEESVSYFKKVRVSEEDFRGQKCVRIKQLQYLR